MVRNGLLVVVNSDCHLEFIHYERKEGAGGTGGKSSAGKDGGSKGGLGDMGSGVSSSGVSEEDRRTFSLQHIDSHKVLSLDYAESERLFGVLMVNRSICFI